THASATRGFSRGEHGCCPVGEERGDGMILFLAGARAGDPAPESTRSGWRKRMKTCAWRSGSVVGVARATTSRVERVGYEVVMLFRPRMPLLPGLQWLLRHRRNLLYDAALANKLLNFVELRRQEIR